MPKRSGLFVCLFLEILSTSLSLAQTADFYVAKNGSNQWSGTLPAPNADQTDGPFASVARAQQAVRKILVNPQGRSSPIVVMVRQGKYLQSKPLLFSAQDAGSAQLGVLWENYPGEVPVISGGMRLTAWTNPTGNTWTTALPAGTQYFEQLFYNGQRRLRPRLGSSSSTNLGAYYRIAATVYLNAPPPPSPPPDPNCAVYVNGSGWECFDRFQYNPSDPISANWKNLAPPAGNSCSQPAGEPNLVGDIEMVDFELFTVSKLRISCIDGTNHIVYLTGPVSSPNPSVHGFLTNSRYVVENVEDELQQPGQWFLDRSAQPWTLTYLANPGENPNDDWVVVPQARQVLVASDLQYVTFRRITFANDNFVVPPAGYPSLHGDVNLTAAVSCQNCSNVSFDEVIVTQTSGGGIEFIPCVNSLSAPWCANLHSNATTANNSFGRSAVYDIGAWGIRVGWPPDYTNTDSNVVQFVTVQNNVIEGVGRTFPASAGIEQGAGHDNLYTHNDIYDSYHAAISICEAGCYPGTTNSQGTFNNTVSFNHTYNLMQGILNDTGAIHFYTGNENFTASGNKILNNKVHDVTDASVMDGSGYGGHGLYLDGETGLVDVENNLVYRTSDSAMFQNCPQLPNAPNTIKNNILAFAQPAIQGVGCPAVGGNLQFDFTNNLVVYGNPATFQLGCAYCPAGNCPAAQNYASNLYCDISSAKCSLPSTPFQTTDSSCSVITPLSWSSWRKLNEDLGSVVANPVFVNPYYPADDFTLKSSSAVSKVGFVPFDPNEAGRTVNSIQPPAIAATFVTASMIVKSSATVSSNLSPSSYGQAVTFTATVTSPFGPPPDGQLVNFMDGSQILGTGSLTRGVASFTTSTLATGGHQIQASCAAGDFWPTTTSQPIRQTVAKASSAVTLASSQNPSTYGQSVTLTGTVTSAGGIPTGTVEFKSGSQLLGVGTLSDGVATFATNAMKPALAPITAVYKADDNFLGSSSVPMNQTVNEAVSNISVTSDQNPAVFDQAITFTATVTSPTTDPTGLVRFYSGTDGIGSSVLSNGTAVLTTSSFPKPGTYSVTAVYEGNNNVLGSTSLGLAQVVNQTGTTTVLTPQPNPSQSGQNVTLTAVVTPAGGGDAPTGEVTFQSGSTRIGKVSLQNGKAALTTSFSTGTYQVTATYSGNVKYQGSSGKRRQSVK